MADFADPLARLAELPEPVLEVLANVASDASLMTVEQKRQTTSYLIGAALACVARGDRASESVLSNLGALLAATEEPEAWAEVQRRNREEESA